MAAVNNNNYSTTKILINYGANVNAVDHSGWSAIFYAVWNSNLQMASLLIDNGAQTDINDDSGVSLYEIAEAKGISEIIDLL